MSLRMDIDQAANQVAEQQPEWSIFHEVSLEAKFILQELT